MLLKITTNSEVKNLRSMNEIKKKLFLELDEIPAIKQDRSSKLKVLFLADNKHEANVVQDYINAFTKHSQHYVEIINPIHDNIPDCFELLKFDIILIHYSIYILSDYFLPKDWSNVISRFSGLKVLIIQDEYRLINEMKAKITELEISIIISSLEPKNSKLVYGDNTPSVNMVISCIPGYISDSMYNVFAPPIAKRSFDIVYRGRILQPSLGLQAYDKYRIGEEIKQVAKSYNLKIDILSGEQDRIYGHKWNSFISSGRAMLGLEGGASFFDFDGRVTKLVSEIYMNNPKADFFKVWDVLVRQHEGNIKHETITPKILEAIAAKTALILYPGKYRGILLPERHFIELKRDHSNIDEVVKKINDTEKLQEMVDRTHDEILYLNRITFVYFIKKIDQLLIKNQIKPNGIGHLLFEKTVNYLRLKKYFIKKKIRQKIFKILESMNLFSD
jgi:hypothetical protein